MIDISVIIPAYNSASTLKKCIEAFTIQSVPASCFEVILIDDGSSDNTLQLAEELKNDTPFKMVVLSQINQGPGYARNLGIDIAKGHIIAFTDSDCIPSQTWLETIKIEIGKEHTVIGGETVTEELVIYPWQMSPAGQKYITANFAASKVAIGNVRFGKRYKGLVGNDTDFIARVESYANTKYHHIKSMVVEHPVNVLSTKRIIQRASSRINEFVLFQDYGSKAFGSMNALYRPFILGKFSMLSIIPVVLILIIIATLIFRLYLFLGFSMLFILTIFVFHGYKYLVKDHKKIPIKFRLKTLYLLIIYNYYYLLSRVKGSLKYRTIIL